MWSRNLTGTCDLRKQSETIWLVCARHSSTQVNRGTFGQPRTGFRDVGFRVSTVGFQTVGFQTVGFQTVGFRVWAGPSPAGG
eukprot:6132040-Pyramimonas_sp.AAC.1